jgi:hypothetical protein
MKMTTSTVFVAMGDKSIQHYFFGTASVQWQPDPSTCFETGSTYIFFNDTGGALFSLSFLVLYLF